MKRLKSILRRVYNITPRIGPRLWPYALVIGAQKAGTTAIYRYLRYHPDLAMPRTKEFDFFSCARKYVRGTSLYHRNFPLLTRRTRNKITIDVTPSYLGSAEVAAKRIYDYNPHIKLIAVLRDPITRAHSAWQMYRTRYVKNKNWYLEWWARCDPERIFQRRKSTFGHNFAEDIEEELVAIDRGHWMEMPVIGPSRYEQFLPHFLRYFPRDQLLLLLNEEMESSTTDTLRQIERFLGIGSHAWESETLGKVFVGGYDAPVSVAALELMHPVFRSTHNYVAELIGTELPWLRP